MTDSLVNRCDVRRNSGDTILLLPALAGGSTKIGSLNMVMTTSRKTIESDPSLVRTFLKIHRAASEYAMAHPDELAAMAVKKLGQTPADPSLLTAYLDGTAVAADPVNGATYDAGSQSMVFHGSSCDKIKSGAVAKVDVVYGCPSPTIM